MFAALEKNDTEKLKNHAGEQYIPNVGTDEAVLIGSGAGQDHFLRLMKDQTENEYGILAIKAYLDRKDWASVREIKGLRNNWDDHEQVLLIKQTSLQMESMTEFELDINAAGETVGAVFVLRDVTRVQREVVFQQVSVIFIIVFIMAIFAIPLLRR